MSQLRSKRIKRALRNRCLRRGLERLEVRNLLAGDLFGDEPKIAMKEEVEIAEGEIELTAYFGEIEEGVWSLEAKDAGEPRVYQLGADEEAFVLWDYEPEWAFRTLAMADDASVDDEFIKLDLFDGEDMPDESLYFMAMMSMGVLDGEEFESESFEFEEFDRGEYDDEIFYALTSSDWGEIAESALLDVVKDGVIDEGEVWHFGGVTSEEEELITITSVPLFSRWYNTDNPLDANRDGVTTALDALIVFNSLSHFGSVRLTNALFALSPDSPAGLNEEFLVDANNDEFLSPIDALLRLNYLNSLGLSGGLGDSNPDSSEGDGSSGPFASILPGEWDEYESPDRLFLSEPSLLDESEDEFSTAVFGARIRLIDPEWREGDPDDAETEDEFWSWLADDLSDTPLDDELLEVLARI